MNRAAHAAAARGRRAESLAAWMLRLKGFSILARRLRLPAGEIDIVARRGRLLIFVEVKARADVAAAAESLRRRQRARIARAARAFMAARPAFADHAARFDAVLVGGLLPRHVPDAWRDDA